MVLLILLCIATWFLVVDKKRSKDIIKFKIDLKKKFAEIRALNFKDSNLHELVIRTYCPDKYILIDLEEEKCFSIKDNKFVENNDANTLFLNKYVRMTKR